MLCCDNLIHSHLNSFCFHNYDCLIFTIVSSSSCSVINPISHYHLFSSSFQLSEDLSIDSPSYSWKKLDPDSEETKKMVKEFFMQEGDFGGKQVFEGKIFK